MIVRRRVGSVIFRHFQVRSAGQGNNGTSLLKLWTWQILDQEVILTVPDKLHV